jgi:hypothetical protein
VRVHSGAMTPGALVPMQWPSGELLRPICWRCIDAGSEAERIFLCVACVRSQNLYPAPVGSGRDTPFAATRWRSRRRF